ncbi:hypothetical protein ABZ848_42580 [Streptomyces sp. NPDC047081]|uniref:hypothetical protein n=1 Tax=Streptomyces sp. NPDC047081 TaxID=3154706 RepID=UPI0034061F02
MRTFGRGSRAAVLVPMALAAGLVGCSGGGKSEDEGAKACSRGTYAWSGIRHTETLTALADPILFKKKTASYTSHLKPVGDTVYRPTVTSVPSGASAAGVIKALGARLKVEEPLAGPSETDGPEDDHYFEMNIGDLKGAYYAWGWISLVDADFTYTCGSDEPVKGHVRTWTTTGSGFMSCADDPAPQATGRTAARERCPVGSRATKAA